MPRTVHAKVTSRPTADSDQRDREVDEIVDQAVADAAREREASDLVAHADDLLDEIDAILQQEEQFALQYRQRGGE